MTGRRRFPGAVVLAALVIAASAALVAQATQRSMYVSVLDAAGAPVPNVVPSDLIVRDDNVAREVLHVAPADEPMQIEVLVDNSQAAREYIPDIRVALPEFVDALLAPNDAGRKNEVALVALGERPTTLTEPTFDAAQLRKGIDRLFSQPGSGTYLLDGIIEVCQGFKKRGALRPVIVAITTEGPEFSSRHFDLVLDPLQDTGAAFHAIVVGPMSSATSDEARNRAIVLDRGTSTTGGRLDHILTSMALRGKLKQVADDLTHQYLVTFARPQSLIPPQHTTVTAAKAGMTARGTLARESQAPR
ncbi:MAG TPA: VWA domain-containing protein [Vicinamibacterales bacterium]|nr:VWA domain-containing protein [Vicinamibacterales bacterium]